MTLPRNMTDEERELICTGLNLIIRDIEQALIRIFNDQLEKREHIAPGKYNELIDRIKKCSELYKTIGSVDVFYSVPKGELIRDQYGEWKRQE